MASTTDPTSQTRKVRTNREVHVIVSQVHPTSSRYRFPPGLIGPAESLPGSAARRRAPSFEASFLIPAQCQQLRDGSSRKSCEPAMRVLPIQPSRAHRYRALSLLLLATIDCHAGNGSNREGDTRDDSQED